MQQALGSAIVRFHQLYWTRMTTRMAGAFEADFTKSQFMVLGLVATHDAVTMSALAEHTGMLKQQITRIVDRLEEKGYVRRERGADDRRSVCVRVTDRANAYMKDAEQRSMQIIMASLQVLTDEERAQLAGHFDAINAMLKRVPVPNDPLAQKATGE